MSGGEKRGLHGGRIGPSSNVGQEAHNYERIGIIVKTCGKCGFEYEL